MTLLGIISFRITIYFRKKLFMKSSFLIGISTSVSALLLAILSTKTMAAGGGDCFVTGPRPCVTTTACTCSDATSAIQALIQVQKAKGAEPGQSGGKTINSVAINDCQRQLGCYDTGVVCKGADGKKYTQKDPGRLGNPFPGLTDSIGSPSCTGAQH